MTRLALKTAFILSFAFGTCAAAQAPVHEAAVQEIIAAERAFAADTRERGAALSFRAAVAPDAIALRPNPQTGMLELLSARELLERRPATARATDIRWWPIFAGAAASGEMGFTTGPVIFPNGSFGYIFTVWMRQQDGSWRYFFDGGPNVEQAPATTPETPVLTLPLQRVRASSATGAEVEIRRLEQALHRQALRDSRRAILPYLTAGSRLMGSGVLPAIGRADAGRELERRPLSVGFTLLGLRAARSGDLVFSYGRVEADGRHGGYTRIWQRQRNGWRIVIDQIIFPPPPRPA